VSPAPGVGFGTLILAPNVVGCQFVSPDAESQPIVDI
jgi:hypothetical protein